MSDGIQSVEKFFLILVFEVIHAINLPNTLFKNYTFSPEL